MVHGSGDRVYGNASLASVISIVRPFNRCSAGVVYGSRATLIPDSPKQLSTAHTKAFEVGGRDEAASVPRAGKIVEFMRTTSNTWAALRSGPSNSCRHIGAWLGSYVRAHNSNS